MSLLEISGIYSTLYKHNDTQHLQLPRFDNEKQNELLVHTSNLVFIHIFWKKKIQEEVKEALYPDFVNILEKVRVWHPCEVLDS